MPTIQPIIDTEVPSGTPMWTEWFLHKHFLVFESESVGEYLETNQFVEVAVALYVQISSPPLATNIERQLDHFQDTINTHDLIVIPPEFRNDCFPMRLLINPSSGFHCRVLAISC